MIDPLDSHKKEEAQRFMATLPRCPDATKWLIHAFDEFLGVDERFREIISFNKTRYQSDGSNPNKAAFRHLEIIERTYSEERKEHSKQPPFNTIKLITSTLENEEKKLHTFTGEKYLLCDDFCITLGELLHYLEERKLAFYRIE